MKNNNLHKAKKAKNDEFYTQLVDIENELQYYKEHFKNKVVLCNCDNPEWSNFWNYFVLNFKSLGLKKLVSIHYEQNKSSYKLELESDNKDNAVKTFLKQNGDFRSSESIELLNECDIVVTNPPFSLFREFINVLMESGKKFLVIGNKNAITYKEVFKYIKNNKLWIGNTAPQTFIQPNIAEKKQIKGLAIWFTNLEHNKRKESIILYQNYTPEKYPKYDNYDAINVDKVKDIPCDYYAVIGVPITFLSKFNPEQFEIVKFRKGDDEKDLSVKGSDKYFRILIKRKTDNSLFM